MISIHFYAAAKAAVGVGEISVPEPPTTVGELLSDIEAEYAGTTDSGKTVADVFNHCTFLLDGRSARRDSAIGQATRLDVLPPFAGG